MKRTILALLVLPAFAMAQTKPTTKPTTAKPAAKPTTGLIKTKLDSLSYSLGINIAGNLKGIDIDTLSYGVFVEAIKDVLKGRPKKLDEGQITICLNNKLSELNTKAAKKEKEEGAVFLSQNKKRPGVIQTPSGLQYEIITAGNGLKPTAADTVVCHYKGTLLNGKEFDNSYNRGEPISFPVSGVIRGWTEAVQLMPKGSKWKLYIPSDLAYGDRGAGQDIPPGATLIFEVELVDVKTANK
jgi:FKBP-type peptidyl-prolyl cis-trans isomerase FklB